MPEWFESPNVRCKNCNASSGNKMLGDDPGEALSHGDLLICDQCVAVHVVDEDLQLQLMTEGDLQTMPAHVIEYVCQCKERVLARALRKALRRSADKKMVQ